VNKLQRSFLLLSELGPGQLASYAEYRLQLRSGRFEKTFLPACPPCPILRRRWDVPIFFPLTMNSPKNEKKKYYSKRLKF